MKDGARQAESMGTVLVVDDEPVVRDVVARYLSATDTRRLKPQTAKKLAGSSSPKSRFWSSSMSCFQG